MHYNRTKDDEVERNRILSGVVISKWITASFLSTKFALFLQTAIVRTRAPPHFDLIFAKFQIGGRKGGI